MGLLIQIRSPCLGHLFDVGHTIFHYFAPKELYKQPVVGVCQPIGAIPSVFPRYGYGAIVVVGGPPLAAIVGTEKYGGAKSAHAPLPVAVLMPHKYLVNPKPGCQKGQWARG